MPKRINRRKARARANEAAVVATTKNRKERELWKCRGCGKRGKPKAGFPLFPQAPWESRQRQARFPHFHSSRDEADGKVENQEQGFHFPTATNTLSRKTKHTVGRAGVRPRPGAGRPP